MSQVFRLFYVKMERDATITIDFFGSIVPPEVTQAILSYLSPIDIVSASQVSQTFAGLLDSRGIWKRVVEEQFGPLDEQIFKGNTLNWRNVYNCGLALRRFKKHFLASEPINDNKDHKQSFGDLPNEKYSKSRKWDPEAFFFYLDKPKKKPLASLYYYLPPTLNAKTVKLIGFSTNHALLLIGTKLQLWNLKVDCKHTDEHKWMSSPNKEEICKKKCSLVSDISTQFKLKASNIYWCHDIRTALFTTPEGILVIDLNTGEVSLCEVKFEQYGDKDEIVLRSHVRIKRPEQIREVRVMNNNGVSMTFCHVSSANGEFFVNLTTKRVHLFADKACPLTWIAKSMKVAVISAEGDQMRVVDITAERPKILAKYNFDMKMAGVVSSPEGHVLFIWRSWQHHYGIGRHDLPLVRAYLWEIGYMIGHIESRDHSGPHSSPDSSFCGVDPATGKHYLALKGVGIVNLNAVMRF